MSNISTIGAPIVMVAKRRGMSDVLTLAMFDYVVVVLWIYRVELMHDVISVIGMLQCGERANFNG